jgi:adenylate kinase
MEGRCDRCGDVELAHRADDAEGTVRRRLEVYRELTEPLIRYYEGMETPMSRIDADRDVDLIQRELRSAFA